MHSFAIKPDTKSVESVELSMAANTLYTYFSSILIDELYGLNEHVIYSDANALSEGKKAYLVGEQLVVGEALVFGRYDFDDVDATISQEELALLVSYELPLFYEKALQKLSQTDINLYRTFEVEKNGEKIALNAEWVLYTFNIADERTREYFLNELQKVLDAKKSVEEYLQKMAQLAMNVAG